MKKSVYVVELKTKNVMGTQTLKTTARLDSVLKDIEAELKPKYPVATVKVYAENGVTAVVRWDVSIEQRKMYTEKNLMASISFVNKRGKYEVIRDGFDSINEVKMFVKFLIRDGAKNVSYEVLKRKGE